MQIWKTKGSLLVLTKGLRNWSKSNPPKLAFFALFGIFFVFHPILSQQETQNKEKPTEVSRKAVQIQKSLKYGTTSERKSALQDLEKLPEEERKPILDLLPELLKKEKEPGMKVAFLKTIGNLKVPHVQKELYEFLEDKNEDVARQALSAIRKTSPPGAWEKVFERLQKEDLTKNSNLTVSLIEALMELEGGEGAASFLESKLKENFNHPEIRAQIALYMGRKKISSSESTLQKIAFDEKEAVTLRTYAIYSLGKIQSTSSIPKIRELMEELRNQPTQDTRKSQLLKVYSLAALVDLNAENVMEELLEYARDDDSYVRFRAVQLLAETKKPEAKEMLEYKSSKDPSPRIQKYAKEKLEKWNENKQETPENLEEEK